jgi:hypothetical protein
MSWRDSTAVAPSMQQVGSPNPLQHDFPQASPCAMGGKQRVHVRIACSRIDHSKAGCSCRFERCWCTEAAPRLERAPAQVARNVQRCGAVADDHHAVGAEGCDGAQQRFQAGQLACETRHLMSACVVFVDNMCTRYVVSHCGQRIAALTSEVGAMYQNALERRACSPLGKGRPAAAPPCCRLPCRSSGAAGPGGCTPVVAGVTHAHQCCDVTQPAALTVSTAVQQHAIDAAAHYLDREHGSMAIVVCLQRCRPSSAG